MAVFRVEKTQNYTVMSNHHLRNESLTLKAKGLLSQMLSLPENWDFTLTGLSHINRENVTAIRTAVQELEAAGYIVTVESNASDIFGDSVEEVRREEYGGILYGIIGDLEQIGYSVQTFIIPACAVNAPHRRDRIAIVAYNTECE